MKSGSALVFALAVVATTLPSAAAPKDARVVAVFRQGDCRSAVCDPDTDAPLTSGSTVSGPVQVHVSAAADLGLEWVRLEARTLGDPEWYCLEFWNASRATTFSSHRNWGTARWTDPSSTCAEGNCSSCAENSAHRHGEVSSNVEHELRVLAHEQGANVSTVPDDASPPFILRLANPGRAPTWVGSPKTATRDGRPVVHLSWAPGVEEDISEYHFIREDPDGTEVEFAVSAADPAAQGCAAVGTAEIRCVDDRLPRPGGAVRYAVASYRKAPAGAGKRCALSNARCVRSALSSVRTVSVPASGTSGDPSIVTSPGTSHTSSGTAAPVVAPSQVEQPSDETDQIAAGDTGGKRGGSGPIAALAAVVAALVVAGALIARRRAVQEPGEPLSNPQE